MGGAFVVTLREAFEAALVLGIVYTYLDRTRAGGHGMVTLGAAAGVVASALMGWAMTALSGPLADVGPDVVAVVVMFSAAALLTWHGWWMRQHARSLRGTVERRLEDARSGGRLWVLGLIAFTGVFREGAETVLFLWGLVSQTGASGWANATGGALGVLVAASLGWLVFAGGRRVPLRAFFTATSALLLLVAAGLCASGVGRLEGLGVLPRSPAVWDTSAVLDDHGLVGSFVAGLTGYRARPSTFEAAVWVAFLGVAGALSFGRAGVTGPAAGGPPAPSREQAREQARKAGAGPA